MTSSGPATPSVTELLGQEAIDALQRPTGEARGLPGRAYHCEAFFELERRTVFSRGWTAAAMASDIPRAGDVWPLEVAGWPLVLVRGNDGVVRCFHNICRHRGAAVVTEPAAGQRALRCPWHAWTYALDGSLRGTPEFGGVGCHHVESLHKAESGLVPVRVGQWFDLLFVNPSGEARPLEEHLAPLHSRFASLDFSRCAPGGSWSSSYPGNWKLSVESGIEDLHLPWVHPQLVDGADRGDACGVELGGDCYYGSYTVHGKWTAGRGPAGLPALPRLPGLGEEDARKLLFVNIFPSGVLGVTPDSLYAGVWLPEGAERTRLRFRHYFAEEAAADEAHAATRAHIIEAVQGVFAQDGPLIGGAQARARARDALGLHTRFSPFWETAVHGFQKRVVGAMMAE